MVKVQHVGEVGVPVERTSLLNFTRTWGAQSSLPGESLESVLSSFICLQVKYPCLFDVSWQTELNTTQCIEL